MLPSEVPAPGVRPSAAGSDANGGGSRAGAAGTEQHRLYCGDCLDPVTGLAGLPDGSVDVAIMDPPYSEWTHAKVRRGGSVHAPDVTTGGPKRPVISTSVVLGFDALAAEVRSAVAAQLARVVKRWILAFSDAESVHLWERDLTEAGAEHVRRGAWIKLGCTPQFTGDRPAVGFEEIEIAHAARVRGRMEWNGGGRAAAWSYAVESGSGRIHTTQKPLDLMEALIRDFTNPGDLVLDPFSGGGTTLVAAKRLGRRALGWERDPDFHAAAAARLAAAREQPRCWWGALPQLGLFSGERAPKPKQASLLTGDAP